MNKKYILLFTPIHKHFLKVIANKFGYPRSRSYIYHVNKNETQKVMNALVDIQNEAKVIVEQLADKQINGMKERQEKFQQWMAVEGNPMMQRYTADGVDVYGSAEKYVYLTQHKTWNRELGQYEIPTEFVPGYNGSRREMYRDELELISELRMTQGTIWENKYREAFISANMVKLNRALAKHLNDEMTAYNIHVEVGADGAEVDAFVDGKLFRTFATLCGGYVQQLHYRYRSSLK